MISRVLAGQPPGTDGLPYVPLSFARCVPEHESPAFARCKHGRGGFGQGLTAVAGLVTIVVLTRHLGPTEFGYYRTVLTYCAFAAVLADCGLYMITLREMSRVGAGHRAGGRKRIALRFVSTGSVLLAAAAVAWATPYDPTVKWGVLIGAAIYTCLQASDFFISIFQSVLKQGRNAVAEVVGAVATLAAVWVLATTSAGALPMLCATLLGAMLAVAISWRLARRLVPFHLSFDLAFWRQLMVAGLPLAGAQILGMAMLRGDSLLLSFYKPASDVGLYGVPSNCSSWRRRCRTCLRAS